MGAHFCHLSGRKSPGNSDVIRSHRSPGSAKNQTAPEQEPRSPCCAAESLPGANQLGRDIGRDAKTALDPVTKLGR